MWSRSSIGRLSSVEVIGISFSSPNADVGSVKGGIVMSQWRGFEIVEWFKTHFL